MSSPSTSASYRQGGGLLVLLGAATVEQTGLVIGRTYEFVAIDGGALCRWGADDAAIADGGFDFAVPKNGGPVRSVATAVAINIIESDAASIATAVVLISEVEG